MAKSTNCTFLRKATDMYIVMYEKRVVFCHLTCFVHSSLMKFVRCVRCAWSSITSRSSSLIPRSYSITPRSSSIIPRFSYLPSFLGSLPSFPGGKDFFGVIKGVKKFFQVCSWFPKHKIAKSRFFFRKNGWVTIVLGSWFDPTNHLLSARSKIPKMVYYHTPLSIGTHCGLGRSKPLSMCMM